MTVDPQPNSFTWKYDPTGSRTQQVWTRDGQAEVLDYVNDHGVLSEVKNGAATVGSYSYTAGFVNNAAGAAVQYDAFGAVKAAGEETYVNNPFGERIQRVQNGVTTWLAPWGGKTLLEAEETGGTKKLRRIYHHDSGGRVLRKREFSYEQSSPETLDSYYHYDGRSSVSVLTDATGALLQKYHYLPYGGLMEGSDVKNRYGFSGKDLVPGTDLLDFGPRFMGPGVGRFLGPDPLELSMTLPQTLNRYRYVRNNPLSELDQTGKASLEEIVDECAEWWTPDGNYVEQSQENSPKIVDISEEVSNEVVVEPTPNPMELEMASREVHNTAVEEKERKPSTGDISLEILKGVLEEFGHDATGTWTGGIRTAGPMVAEYSLKTFGHHGGTAIVVAGELAGYAHVVIFAIDATRAVNNAADEYEKEHFHTIQGGTGD